MTTSYLLARDVCSSQNHFNGENLGARISAVFVILIVSAIGAFFPLIAKRNPYFTLPKWCFFITRYFGSGVIVATGFIHLLAEADQALSDECLGGVFDEYPWAEGIALMGLFLMFLLDIVAHRRLEDKVKREEKLKAETGSVENENSLEMQTAKEKEEDAEEVKLVRDDKETANIYQQILNSFLLEFGIVFHSVFVGLSLAIAGNEFKALYVAIAFHQMFEGLGLGTRFAMTPWPEDKQYIPWVLALAYSLTTPIAIAIGLGVRNSYPPGSRVALITTGCFDALCSGILIYNSLVELMAYDFIFSPEFKTDDGMKRMLWAYFCLAFGAAIMALIGKWA
ncbi:unnamed protein product [Debaryomyces tyrocola]|nr:unnamed protein product [Debaryomyces tyrocola]